MWDMKFCFSFGSEGPALARESRSQLLPVGFPPPPLQLKHWGAWQMADFSSRTDSEAKEMEKVMVI